jgi:hypothetical protein
MLDTSNMFICCVVVLLSPSYEVFLHLFFTLNLLLFPVLDTRNRFIVFFYILLLTKFFFIFLLIPTMPVAVVCIALLFMAMLVVVLAATSDAGPVIIGGGVTLPLLVERIMTVQRMK